MRSRNFYQLDVFTEKVFAGHPPAVFLECEDLSGEEMQQIAREMISLKTVFCPAFL